MSNEQKINKDTAILLKKSAVTEAFKLEPTAIVHLFTIDISDVAFHRSGISPDSLISGSTIFRFHNHLKLTDTSIWFAGVEYIAAPIAMEGFEMSAKGTLPTPELSLSVPDEGIPLLAALKQKISELGDLVGAKVVRIRTFAKFLDGQNFEGSQFPAGFEPNHNAILGRDIFFIDRKIVESKNIIKYELASILDVEGIMLPNRLVLASKCVAKYRGEGCCYEYNANKNPLIHKGVLPDSAPPVATDNNELITEIIDVSNIIVKGVYKKETFYYKGDSVFVEYNGIKYYYVCKEPTSAVSPPNQNFWIQDSCSKTVRGCELRFGANGSVVPQPISSDPSMRIEKGKLPYVGFPSVNKLAGTG